MMKLHKFISHNSTAKFVLKQDKYLKYLLEKEDTEKPGDLFLDALHPTEKVMKNAYLFIQSIYMA